MPNWIGDLVMATPILEDLRNAYPQAKITAMCRTPIADLLKGNPHIDAIFYFSKKGPIAEKKILLEKLKKGKYDLGILLTNSFSSAWWFWQGKVKNRLGYASNSRALFLSYDISFPESIHRQHLVKTYKNLLSPLGIPLSTTPPRLFLEEEEIEKARHLLKQHGVSSDSIIVGINPGAAYGTAKCWLPERFREVTEKLLENKEVFIVYFGDQLTAPLVNDICKALPERVINLAGLTSLREYAALISLCRVLLTNDSGPMHMADALGTPLIALFGSTSDVTTGPYRGGKVIHKRVKCSPCYQRTCPIDFPCMKQIEAKEVSQALENILKTSPPKLSIYV